MNSNKLDFVKNFKNLDQRSLANKVLENIKKKGSLTSEFGPLEKSKHYNALNSIFFYKFICL